MAGRADLARQRQHLRAKPTSAPAERGIGKEKKKMTKPPSLDTAKSEPKDAPQGAMEAATKPVRRTSGARKPSTVAPVSALGSANMALVVRQVLQRKQYGDPGEYLSTTSKEELFRLLTQIAHYANELREKQQADQASIQEEIQRKEQRAHEIAGRLIEVEAQLHASEVDREQLSQRLLINSSGYSSVVDTLRKYEDKWNEMQTTMAQQQQLLQEMSRSLDERIAQVDTLIDENATMKTALAEGKNEITTLTNQLVGKSRQVLQIESERSQQQLADERRENKAVLWELQSKTRDYDDVSDQLDDAKSRLLTLEDQLQMELIARKALVQERDAVHLLHRRERDEWKNTEAARGEADYRRAQEYRSMDLELRQLRQAVGRLRTDLEKEQSQREKAESAALRATDIADELKATGKAFQTDVQRLTTELQEERAVRESKEGALVIAYRELQSLQKRVREEESARQDAQNEVEALMHRMKLIRRDHLTMLHRVEIPPRLVAHWRDPVVSHQQSPKATQAT